jgi:hypothetical protein
MHLPVVCADFGAGGAVCTLPLLVHPRGQRGAQKAYQVNPLRNPGRRHWTGKFVTLVQQRWFLLLQSIANSPQRAGVNVVRWLRMLHCMSNVSLLRGLCTVCPLPCRCMFPARAVARHAAMTATGLQSRSDLVMGSGFGAGRGPFGASNGALAHAAHCRAGRGAAQVGVDGPVRSIVSAGIRTTTRLRCLYSACVLV